jgi:TusA-related sulfurtransferase
VTARRCETASLELGGGLEVLVSAALGALDPGQELDVVSEARSAALELPAWARITGHEVVDERQERTPDGVRYVVRLRRGSISRVLGESVSAGHTIPVLPGGGFPTGEARRVAEGPPAEAVHTDGLIPLGAHPEQGSARYDWPLTRRDELWSDKLASLTDRAARSQWNATTDIPWDAGRALKPDVERAVSQVMTYIAQNEYAAYYVPARYLAVVHPAYVEVLMWLASHVHDEARHVEVFTKRALLGGYRAHALASTELSLHTLLQEQDFTAAALLLNVLGEGTFLDLLNFVAVHAPDAATATAARLAHQDERRHVQFGISHIRRRLGLDPDERNALAAAVERRAARLASLDGLNPIVTESLVVMTARSAQPADIGEAGDAVRKLMSRMHVNRIRRLEASGFDTHTARHLSELHTPNLM